MRLRMGDERESEDQQPNACVTTDTICPSAGALNENKKLTFNDLDTNPMARTIGHFGWDRWERVGGYIFGYGRGYSYGYGYG